jgi:YHS domain-containing protein
MYSFLVRFLMLIGVIWLLRRLLSFFADASKKAGSKNNPASTSNHMVKDPICGMYMDSRLAIRLESGKEEVYFCSEDCKNKYLGKSPGEETSSAEMR